MSNKQQGGRVPEIPRELAAPLATAGQVPAECAAGFAVTRVPNRPEAIGEAKNRGQVVVYAGDRNPDNPDEPLIRNEESFVKTPEGLLTYRGDVLVVWRTEYAEAYRVRQAQRAQTASAGGEHLSIRRVPLAQAMSAQAE